MADGSSARVRAALEDLMATANLASDVYLRPHMTSQLAVPLTVLISHKALAAMGVDEQQVAEGRGRPARERSRVSENESPRGGPAAPCARIDLPRTSSTVRACASPCSVLFGAMMTR